MIIPFLFLFLSPMDDAISYSRKGDFEKSEKILHKVKSSSPTYAFYRLVNNFSLNNKRETLRWASDILDAFHQDAIPQRYKDLAFIMRLHAEDWKDDYNDMADISREMMKIKDRLKNGKGGKTTQKMQDEVAERLKRMIKDIEDAQEKKKQEEEKKNNPKDEPSVQPAKDTVPISPQKNTGQVDMKRVKEIAEVWGRLPEKERASALRSMMRGLPKEDVRVIEKYFAELQKRSSK